MEVKRVELERQTTPNNPNGTFGFSVLGGAGTKFPAVVCEVDVGGPADRCGKIHVGDCLTLLNGEKLDDLTPNELVQRIRSAPSRSSFVLSEDQAVKEQVLSLLRKQEKRRQQRAAVSQQQHHVHKKVNVASMAGRNDNDKRKRVIEVEPPVNRDGGEGVIVQVVDNRIVGQVEMGSSGTGEDSGMKAMENKPKSPHRSPMLNRSEGSPRPGIPTESVSMDTTSHHGNASTAVSTAGGIGLNGMNSTCSSSSPSEVNCSTKNTNVDEWKKQHEIYEDDTPVGKEEEPKLDCAPGGNTVVIPQLRAAIDAHRGHRGSLSEVVLVNELSKTSTADEETNPSDAAARVPDSPKWIDPDEKKRLIQLYNVGPTRSNSRKQKDQSSQAVTLARKLYMLDGFKKSEVAARLSQPTEFGKAVAREYLSFFDFAGLEPSDALRQFLVYFSLTGESQERERVMQHFSERYYQCNPHAFPSSDAVHGLSVATLLLNTDLHTDHGGRKMSLVEFSDNLGYIGVELPRPLLKQTYDSIKRNPLLWAMDDPVSPTEGVVEDEIEERVYHITIPGTFVQAVLPGSAPVFKEGFIMKKNIMEAPHKKVPRGKRHWKPYYAYLKGFVLYFAPPQGQGELHLDDTSSAITVTHCLAMRAHDYHKKSSVVRVTTADWHVFLLQATDVTDMQQWIGATNKAAALYSSPPLAAPIGSKSGFHRPTFPLAPTRNNQEQQIESLDVKVKSLEKEAKEHQAKKPTGKNAKHGYLEEWFDQYEFLQFEINRFRIYLASLCSDLVIDFNAPLPSGLIPSPSISTLHNPDQASGESDFLEEFHRHGHTSHIVGTPQAHRDNEFQELRRHSPVLSRKPQFKHT